MNRSIAGRNDNSPDHRTALSPPPLIESIPSTTESNPQLETVDIEINSNHEELFTDNNQHNQHILQRQSQTDILSTESLHLDVDSMLERLLTLKTDKSVSRPYYLQESEITNMCHLVRNVFLEQPVLLELEGPVKICGDIHGQFLDLLRLFELCGYPGNVNYLFLGDYVDRGKQSIETICLLLCFKLKFPSTFFLLRGNHECQAITRIYGFYDECKRRFSVKLWKCFLDVFNCLPVAAIVENQIFCCHGGLSQEFFKPEVNNLQELRRLVSSIPRPTEIPEHGLLCDLLWADPWYPEVMTEKALKELHGWGPNERGVSYVFASDVVDAFLDRFGLDLIVRAHQVVEDGFEFYAGRSLVTLFSAPNYCGEFENAGGIFCLRRNNGTFNQLTKSQDVDLEGSFQILTPMVLEKKRSSSSGNALFSRRASNNHKRSLI